jgi:hypothetical protein
MCGIGDPARPFGGGCAAGGTIGEHAGNPVIAQGDHDDSAFVPAGASRRIDRHHHPLRRRHSACFASLLEHRPGPQRAFDIFQQLAADFLPGELRFAEFAGDRFKEPLRQIASVGGG